MKPNKNNIGNTGEYYLASKLSALDCIVTVTLGRAEAFDLLVVTKNGKGKHLRISVKTSWSIKSKSFILNEKAEQVSAPDLYYAFVKLHENKVIPEVWIVPSAYVAKVLTQSHKNYLNSGHKQNPLRGFPISKPKSSWYDFVNFKKIDERKDNYSVFI